jgi:hypothetical protein
MIEMATLRLIFHGLLGYVVRGENDAKATADSISVLFPKQPLPQQAFASEPFVSAAHFPFLRFAKSIFDPSSPRKPQYEVAGFGGDPDCILFLEGESLSIPNSNGGVALARDATIPPAAEKPSSVPAEFERQKKDFRWVARMKDAVAGSEVADTDPLNGNQKDLVEAVFEIVSGQIGCSKLVGETLTQANTMDASTFTLPNKTQRQALSEEIYVEMEAAGQVYFFSTPLPSADPRAPGPQPALILNAGKSEVVECHVFNSELDVILKPPSLPVQSKDPRDFVQLYELSATRPPVGSRLAPVNNSPIAGDHICPGAVFHG